MDKKIAIMQPYFLPYLGYFQLIASVDEFILFDDVNYIKKGWINRNNFILNGKKQLQTIPIIKASQNKKINELQIVDDIGWKNEFLENISRSYKDCKYFNEIYPVITDIVLHQEQDLCSFIEYSLSKVMEYLEIKTKLIYSSDIVKNEELKGQSRIIDICLKMESTFYINAIGGIDLYDKNHFLNHGINLKFISTEEIIYEQSNNKGGFEPYMSIIDYLMNVSKLEVKNKVNNFKLI